MSVILTPDQEQAKDAFHGFLLNPAESVFVLEGYSGTGKSTLVKVLLEEIPKVSKVAELIYQNKFRYDVELTATTNKAAEALRTNIGGLYSVSTIHAKLGLRVHTDYYKNTTTLIPRDKHLVVEDTILFIDEASFIDEVLLKHIFTMTKNCKVVFIGDPAQLLTVGCDQSPVFSRGFKGAKLEKVVRQAEGNPIIELSTLFRNTVNTGKYFSFVPDGVAVQHLPRDQFEQSICAEFLRPDWRYDHSKVLAWTNKTVINYNHAINNLISGDPLFSAGDYAVVNRYITDKNNNTFKTDELVHVVRKSDPEFSYGLEGHYYTIQGSRQAEFFMPNSLQEKKDLIAQATREKNVKMLTHIDTKWIDLRSAFACTINKSQGSTFKKVFIDLDDLKKCSNGNQLARLLYVGVSRASDQVIFTGDLV